MATVAAEEDSYGRIKRGSKGHAPNAVFEFCRISFSDALWVKTSNLFQNWVRHGEVGIERQNPLAFDSGLANRKVPLACVAFKLVLKKSHLEKTLGDLARGICTEAVHDHNIASP